MGLFRKRKTQRASRMNIKPPAPEEGRHGLAIVLIVKDEEDYLQDWLTFHAAAGVRHIFVYDNGSTDRTAEIARDFKGCNTTVISWVFDLSVSKPEMVLPRQILCYCHAISNFGGGYRWMAFIDVDEFLVPRGRVSIPDALDGLAGFTNLSVPWVMFGHNGHASTPADPVPYAFTKRARELSGPLLNFKCIVDPCDVTQVSTHKFRTNAMQGRSANTKGETAENKRRTGDFVTTEVLQLNHYYLLSEEEMRRKMERGGVSGVENSRRREAISEKAALIELSPQKDLSAVEFLNCTGVADAGSFRDLYARHGEEVEG